jgi:hypothetical protein
MRWPGGLLDLSSGVYEMDSMKVTSPPPSPGSNISLLQVSEGFLQVHAALAEDLALLVTQLGTTSAKVVMRMVLLFMIQEMRQTVMELKLEAGDEPMNIGRGGLQQLLVDVTFLHTMAVHPPLTFSVPVIGVTAVC